MTEERHVYTRLADSTVTVHEALQVGTRTEMQAVEPDDEHPEGSEVPVEVPVIDEDVVSVVLTAEKRDGHEREVLIVTSNVYDIVIG